MNKVSVIVPVYNVEPYIARCMNSLLNQSLKSFECLVINDGTKDRSIEIAKKITGVDPRFIYFDKENGGLSDARNFGLRIATGEYICFLDSDDALGRTALQKAYDKAKECDSDITVFDMVYEYEDGREKEICADDFRISSYKENKELLFINNSANNKIFRTSFMKGRRFIKGMWYEDLAVVPLWIAEANNVSRVPEPLYFYLQRKGSISHSADPRIFDIYKALSNLKDILHITPDDMYKLYLDNCLVMTTLRIRDISDTKTRRDYYRHNAELLDLHYPNWYEKAMKEPYTKKQKAMFTLLKYRMILLLDGAYNR